MSGSAKNLIVLLCAMLLSTPVLGYDVSGVVFNDVNGNGVQDTGEAGIAGVPISDGGQIVTSGANGQYTIQVTESVPSWVNVTTPDGYRNTNPFYWTATDNNSALNFGLQNDPSSASSTFTFIHGADTHHEAVNNTRLQYYFNSMEQLSNQQDVRFYTCVGDLTVMGKVPNLTAVKTMTDALDRPFYAQFGGHDGLVSMDRPKMGNYVDIMGPYSYSWNYGGVHFISLVSETSYLSSVEQTRQSQWLSADLATLPADKPVVVLAHTPNEIRGEIYGIAQNHNLLAVLRGHYHAHNLQESGDVPVYTSGPWRQDDWGAFTSRVRTITVQDGAIASSETRVMGQEKRMVILSPHENYSTGGTSIAANVYDTTLRPSQVTYEITGQPGQQWTGNLTRQSDWTWTGDILQQLPAGNYQITVTASADGQVWSSQKQFAAGSAAAPASGGDWASVFGSTGGRFLPGSPGDAPEMRLSWVRPTGTTNSYFSSPAVSSGRVYMGLSDGEAGYGKAGVICVDAETGQTVWKKELSDSVHSSVAAEGSNVYALTNQGMLVSLDAATGDILWSQDVYDGTSLSIADDDSFAFMMNLAPVTVDNGRVYVSAQGTVLAAYDALTGDREWMNDTSLNANYQTSGLGIGDGILFALDEDEYIAIDPDTGAERWRQPTAKARGTATPIYADGAVYMNVNGVVRKADPADGSLVWQTETASSMNYMGIPAVGEGTVVVSKADAVIAFDDTDGEILWEFSLRTPEEAELGEYQVFNNGSSPVIYGDLVFVGGDDGYFYVLNLLTGELEWEYQIGTPIKSSPAISGNMVYVSAFDGNIYGFSMVPEPMTCSVLVCGLLVFTQKRFRAGKKGVRNGK
jgi:outer membrane protein assembly factor BamB